LSATEDHAPEGGTDVSPAPEIGTAEGLAAPDASDKRADATGPRFHPWRVFFALLVLVGLSLMLMSEAGRAPFAALSVWADAKGAVLGAYPQGLIIRAMTNPLAIAMATLIAVTLLYGLLQAVGLWVDHRPTIPGASVLRVLSGRPRNVADFAGYSTALHEYGKDSALSPIRLGLTMFPMVGFLGTVIGLSGAIRDLPAAVEDNAMLAPVLDSLYVAFDTTALGLMGAIVCLALTWFFEDSAPARPSAQER